MNLQEQKKIKKMLKLETFQWHYRIIIEYAKFLAKNYPYENFDDVYKNNIITCVFLWDYNDEDVDCEFLDELEKNGFHAYNDRPEIPELFYVCLNMEMLKVQNEIKRKTLKAQNKRQKKKDEIHGFNLSKK